MKSESHSVVSNSLQSNGLYSPWNSSDQNTGVGRVSLLQGIFLIQGSKPGLLNCTWILYHLSHKGSPRMLLFHIQHFNYKNRQMDQIHLWDKTPGASDFLRQCRPAVFTRWNYLSVEEDRRGSVLLCLFSFFFFLMCMCVIQWWFGGWDIALPMQGTRVNFLTKESDVTYHSKDSVCYN